MLNNSLLAFSYVLCYNFQFNEGKPAWMKTLPAESNITSSCMRLLNKLQKSSDGDNSYSHTGFGREPRTLLISGDSAGDWDGGVGGLQEGVGCLSGPWWAFCHFIRIQHTTCKMKQTHSSGDWQLWVCCCSSLQLACQSSSQELSLYFYHLHLSCPLPFSFSISSLSDPLRFHPSLWPS